MMTVKELIEKLAQLPPDLEVLIAEDPEGNGFHAFEDYSTGYAEKELHGYSVVPEEDWEEHVDSGDDIIRTYPGDNVVVLWP